jgi:dynein heavy chain 2
MSVREMIMNYDAHAINAKMRRKVEELLAAKPASFERDSIYRVSQAAGPMAMWVKANIAYARVRCFARCIALR